MADWIDKYPRVKALLQAAEDELLYDDLGVGAAPWQQGESHDPETGEPYRYVVGLDMGDVA